jgi:hypothetical protein
LNVDQAKQWGGGWFGIGRTHQCPHLRCHPVTLRVVIKCTVSRCKRVSGKSERHAIGAHACQKVVEFTRMLA